METATVEVKNDADLRPATVVTGASSGIGRELALVAAREAPVLLVARSADRLAALAQEIRAANGVAYELPLDVTSLDAADKIAACLAAENLYCDYLVNNAGYGLVGAAHELDRSDQLGVVDLNVRAMTALSLAFLPGMMARGRGGILHVASIASFLPGPQMAVYYASKAFVRSFSEALWEECRRAGVAVTALCPGPIDTGFFVRATGRAQKPRLFQLLPTDDARSVAKKGWRGLKAGRRLVVPGLASKGVMLAGRLFPNALILRTVRKLQKRRVN